MILRNDGIFKCGHLHTYIATGRIHCNSCTRLPRPSTISVGGLLVYRDDRRDIIIDRDQDRFIIQVNPKRKKSAKKPIRTGVIARLTGV